MAQLMPLPLIVSSSIKSRLVLAFFLVPAHPGSPGQRAVKRVSVCVCLLCSHWLQDMVMMVIQPINKTCHHLKIIQSTAHLRLARENADNNGVVERHFTPRMGVRCTTLRPSEVGVNYFSLVITIIWTVVSISIISISSWAEWFARLIHCNFFTCIVSNSTLHSQTHTREYICSDTHNNLTPGTSSGFWLGGMGQCTLAAWKYDNEMVHSEVYLNKYVVSIAPFSTPACPDCSQNITYKHRKLLFFACFRFLIFRFLIFHPFLQGGQLTPFAPMCGRPCLTLIFPENPVTFSALILLAGRQKQHKQKQRTIKI